MSPLAATQSAAQAPPPAAQAPAAPEAPVPPTAAAAAPLPAARRISLPPPQTVDQLNGLRLRRREVRDRIEEAIEERDEVAQELVPEGQPAPPPAVTALAEARLKVLDARILGLEAEVDAIDRAITAAAPATVAQAGTLITPGELERQRSNAESDGILQGLAAGIPGGLLLAFLFAAIRRRVTGRRRAEAAPAALPDRSAAQLTAAVEAMAIEIERIGESQRFLTQVLSERRPEVEATRRA